MCKNSTKMQTTHNLPPDFNLGRVTLSQVVIGSIQEDIKEAALPIIHYGLDLWTCKVSGRKYLGIHVSWVDSTFDLRHALISVS